MVDITSAVPGVVGTQIAGAGLGGCVMILARRDCVEAVAKALASRYYRPAGHCPRAKDRRVNNCRLSLRESSVFWPFAGAKDRYFRGAKGDTRFRAAPKPGVPRTPPSKRRQVRG
ncbi:MAG: hypothetical protein NTW96_00315 [Planctomycetia bacterium]|nr:hypothetical protein [Planctomycetia bacterium]